MSHHKHPKDYIFAALDIARTEHELENWAQLLCPFVGGFKIGPVAMDSIGGPQAVRILKSVSNLPIFYDCKRHEVGHITQASIEVLAKLPIDIFTIHASSGRKSLKVAMENRGNTRPAVVTMLSSLDAEDCAEIYGFPPGIVVPKFARWASELGFKDIVCSPQELIMIKHNKHLAHLRAITPGIRPLWAEADGQVRFSTPTYAIKHGSEILVIGTPITTPPEKVGSPIKAVEFITQEIERAIAA